MRRLNKIFPQLGAQWANLILMIGISSTLIVSGAYTIWPLAFSLIGLIVWLRNKPARQKWFADPEVSAARRLLLSSFFCFITVSISLGLYHKNPAGGYQAVLPFAIYPILAGAIVHHRVDPFWFWVGTSIGAVAAAFFAGFQIFIQGLTRAHGLINPITFGDTAVVLCAACLIGLSHLDFSQPENRNLKSWLIAGSFCGMTASLLSGSKGGWLSLCTVSFFAIGKMVRPLNFARKIATLGLIVSLSAIAFAVTPKSTLQGRLESGWQGLRTWLKTGEVTEMSVSIRMELWAAGLQIFKENPWFGSGHELTQKRRLDLAASGQFSPRLAEIKTFDNEYINKLANGGILGILPSILLFALPFLAFYRFRNHENSSIRALGILGMFLPILYMEFGISVAIFGTNAFRQVYASWLITLIALIAVTAQDNSENPIRNKSYFSAE